MRTARPRNGKPQPGIITLAADSNILRNVAQYYTRRLQEHGATARGVDWKDGESQALRFEQLARLWTDAPATIGATAVSVAPTPHSGAQPSFSLIDYGCGYGGLLDLLREKATPLAAYFGFDISEEMIRAAHDRHGADGRATFVTQVDSLPVADYTVASGIFNVRLEHDDAAWRAYMQQTIREMAARSRLGLAFNVLTAYSDADRRRPDLFYADPLEWFDFCKRHITPRVSLLHDYPLWEFTILARL